MRRRKGRRIISKVLSDKNILFRQLIEDEIQSIFDNYEPSGNIDYINMINSTIASKRHVINALRFRKVRRLWM